jgi:hypothetical protein
LQASAGSSRREAFFVLATPSTQSIFTGNGEISRRQHASSGDFAGLIGKIRKFDAVSHDN